MFLTRLSILLAAALGSSGCAMFTTPAPTVDAAFGSTVRQVVARQVAQPNAAALQRSSGSELDAQAARHALVKYRDSFKTPPPTFSVISIGGNVGTSGP